MVVPNGATGFGGGGDCRLMLSSSAAAYAPPFDDQNILDDDNLIRRINLDQHTTTDQDTGRKRISTKAFSNSSLERGGGMSVDVENQIIALGLEPKKYVTDPPFLASVYMKAKLVRDNGLIVGSTPTKENPCHADVWSPGPSKFTRGQQKKLLSGCDWYYKPDALDVDLN